MLLHVTGTPGTGKTDFSNWLRAEHGYFRWPPGPEPPNLFSVFDIQSAVAGHSDAVLDWNVLPDGIRAVEWVQSELGFETWWFDGDRETGLEVFRGREGHPANINHYTNYMNGIARYWSEYQRLFEDRYLEVLQPGPTFMPHEKRLDTILAYPRKPA
jgi:hypothetical protein